MRGDTDSGVHPAEFDWHNASPAVLDAMAFRCAEEGHDARGAVGLGPGPDGHILRVYKVCRWCGQQVP